MEFGNKGMVWADPPPPSSTFLLLTWDLKIQGSKLPVGFVGLKTHFILLQGSHFLSQNGQGKNA